jgi:uncharacterized damage-inducible protein DinB
MQGASVAGIPMRFEDEHRLEGCGDSEAQKVPSEGAASEPEGAGMPPATSNEQQLLLRCLKGQRDHIFEALEGLDVDDLRRPVLPSRWTCVGLVNHLSLDVEQFWFQAVVAGEQAAVEAVLRSSDSAWDVGIEDSVDAVLEGYRRNIERADAIIASRSLDAAPAWWPEDLFGSFRLDSVRAIVLHVITETAAHAGHLDAARELMDGKQHLVLTG